MRLTIVLRALPFALAIVLLVVLRPAKASDGAVIRVEVLDANTKLPLSLARVTIDGVETQFGFTDASGIATFDGEPSGSYTISVAQRGYKASSSQRIDVTIGAALEAHVLLAKVSEPKTIGSVVVKSTSSLSPDSLDAAGPQSRLSQNFGEALGTIPDLSALAGGVSIDGHDPSQSAFSVDGLAIPGLGGSATSQLRGIDADLFGGATVSTRSANGGLGGDIGFRTLEPTISPQGDVSAAYTSSNSSAIRATARGTLGYIGFAFTHAIRGVNGALQDQEFLDTSGLRYLHDDASFQEGDALKIRLPVGLRQSLTFTNITANGKRDEVCRVFSAEVPCGFGPGNIDSLNSRTSISSYKAFAGSTNVMISAASVAQHRLDDGTHRIVDGAFDSESFASNLSGNSELLRAFSPLGDRGIVSLDLTNFSAAVAGASNGIDLSASSARIHYTQAESRALLHMTPAASIASTVGVANGSGGSNVYGKFDGELKMKSDSFALHAETGVGGTSQPGVGVALSPQNLLYNCSGRVAYGALPGDVPGRQSSKEIDGSWSRKGKSFNTSIEAFAQNIRGGTIATLVNATTLSALPPDFPSAVSAFYDSNSGCNGIGALDLNRVYIEESVVADSAVFSGLRASVSGRIGSSIVYGAFSTFQRAVAFSSNAVFSSSTSVSRNGAQLPGVPALRGTALIDYKAPRSPLEAIGLLSYAGAGNGSNLPPNSTLSAGISYSNSRGTFSASVTNLADVHSSAFASPLGASAFRTNGGAVIPAIAQPLNARELRLGYTARVGEQKARSLDAASAASGDDANTGSALRDFPTKVSAKPFAANTSDSDCTPELLPATRNLLDDLRRLDAEAESYRLRNNAYPNTLPAFTSASDRLIIRYARTRGSYGFVITMPGLTTTAIGKCYGVAFADAGYVAARDLPPLNQPPITNEFGFSKQVGFYYSTSAPSQTRDATTDRNLTTLPADALAVRATCPSRFRPLASEVLESVRYGVDRNDSISGIRITSKKNGFAAWTEVRFVTIADAIAFSSCVDTAKALVSELTERGFGSSPLPIVNFSPAFGFYIISGN